MSKRPSVEDWKASRHGTNLKRKGSELVGPCPVCGGRDRFHVRDDGVFDCRQCDSGFQSILEHAGLWKPMHHVFDKPFRANNVVNFPQQSRKLTWTYRTVDGKSFRVVRKDDPVHGKSIHRDPKGIRGPYLPLGHDSLQPTGPIVIVEGETCFDALNGRSRLTWAGGSGSWRQTDWSCVSGREVILWPDNDKSGRKAMSGIAGILEKQNCIVRTLHIPDGKIAGWDAVDAAEEGILEQLLQDARDNDVSSLVESVNLMDGFDADTSKPDHQPLSGLLEDGSITLFHGRPYAGKSTLSVTMALSLITATDFIGCGFGHDYENRSRIPGRIGLIWPEEKKSTVQRKVEAAMRSAEENGIAINRNAVEDGLFLLSLSQHVNVSNVHAICDGILRLVEQLGLTCIMIDNLAAIAPGCENAPEDVTIVFEGLELAARKARIPVLLLHHDRKAQPGSGAETGSDMARGSSAIMAKARIQIQSVKSDDGIFTLSLVDANNSPSGDAYEFEFKSQSLPFGGAVVAHMRNRRDPLEGRNLERALSIIDSLDDDRKRHSDRAAGWIGIAIGEALNLDVGSAIKGERDEGQSENRAAIKRQISEWIRKGTMKVENVRRENRSVTKIVSLKSPRL